ncbi:MAG TPA: hypothetical protein DCY94_02885 [Firmicutes bacterium]|nr:hypothetical protein [Bacillota bacterium]
MKILNFSHESDIDGLGGVILSKYAFATVDYILSPSVQKMEPIFREKMEDGSLDAYDFIFATDLALDNPALELLANDQKLNKKVQILDHHAFSIDKGLGKYPFTKIIEKDDNGRKTCGTELFYRYLLDRGLITRKSIIDDLVELTRLEDTWEWKKAGERGLKAHDLAILMSAIGIERYIDCMVKKLNSPADSIEFSEEEMLEIENKKAEFRAKMASIWEEAEFLDDYAGNRFAVIPANYEYRNEIAEYIRSLEDKKGIKYVVIIALDKAPFGQKSYRSIEDGFDVNIVAMAHGGGGHPEAASVNITEEQKTLSLKMSQRDRLKYLAESNF